MHRTGYSTSINGAAQHIIDLIDAQKDYGNDYVNQGMRYVGGMQPREILVQWIENVRLVDPLKSYRGWIVRGWIVLPVD